MGDQMYQWAQGSFEAVTPEGRFHIDGFVYKGLGLERIADIDGDDWDITHIASGYRVGSIKGLDFNETMKLAAFVADLTDWTAFGAPDQTPDPLLLTKLLMVSDLMGGALIVTGLDDEQSVH